MSKARWYAAAGVSVGAFGFGFSLWGGSRWLVGFCGVAWGSTLTMASLAWKLAERKP